mmetsp:Transcript_16474/g.39493  ORF Transcript_16474/g.39493 Transcript_16474/m.39493 type:complete len:335 (+) Transcript_16474:1437-2441(+)
MVRARRARARSSRGTITPLVFCVAPLSPERALCSATSSGDSDVTSATGATTGETCDASGESATGDTGCSARSCGASFSMSRCVSGIAARAPALLPAAGRGLERSAVRTELRLGAVPEGRSERALLRSEGTRAGVGRLLVRRGGDLLLSALPARRKSDLLSALPVRANEAWPLVSGKRKLTPRREEVSTLRLRTIVAYLSALSPNELPPLPVLPPCSRYRCFRRRFSSRSSPAPSSSSSSLVTWFQSKRQRSWSRVSETSASESTRAAWFSCSSSVTMNSRNSSKFQTPSWSWSKVAKSTRVSSSSVSPTSPRSWQCSSNRSTVSGVWSPFVASR